MVDFNNRSFKQESPVFETLCGDSSGEPSAKEHNNPIAFTDTLDDNSRLSLRLRIIERRRKAGQSHKFDEKFQTSLFQAIQAAYISLLLEIWFLPAELTPRNASAIVYYVELYFLIFARCSCMQLLICICASHLSSDSCSTVLTICPSFFNTTMYPPDKLMRRAQREENSNLHPRLRQRCIEACQVGFELKTKIIKHEVIKIPSIYDSAQVINKVREGLFRTFHTRIFDQDDDYRMFPPRASHTEEEIQNTRILIVARRNQLVNEARIKMKGSALAAHMSDTPEVIAELESGHQEMTSMASVDVPRQIHIIVTLEGKMLRFWFYNVQSDLRVQFLNNIKSMCLVLDSRGLLLNRILLHKLRHELPPHYTHHAAMLPKNSTSVKELVEDREMGGMVGGQSGGGTFKSNEITKFYQDIYDNYHPGLLRVKGSVTREREPIRRHGLQLARFMQCDEARKAEEETSVDLDDPDLPEMITREQAKQLKKNARLLHYVASPLLFSSKIRSLQGSAGGKLKSSPEAETAVGFELKTKIIKHEVIKIPSIYDSAQVINKVREGLFRTFHTRIFDQDDDYRMFPPRASHTEEEIQNTRILIVARRNQLVNEARIKMKGSALAAHMSDTPEVIAELESGHQEMTSMASVDVPRQIHIIVTLEGKMLRFWFYNVQSDLRVQFLNNIKSMCLVLDSRGLLLNRILLHKLRHELPPHYTHHAAMLPKNSTSVKELVEDREMGGMVGGQSGGGTFKSNEITKFYQDIYDNYHPGLLRVKGSVTREREPIRRHGLQLARFMQCDEARKAEEETSVDLDDPDLPEMITREQAKQLKKNARLLHYVASPLLFSSKIRSLQTDKETYSYVSSKGSTSNLDLDHPAWFLAFKKRLLDKFLEYLKDPMRGIRMQLRYEAEGVGKEVHISQTLNDDDNESILCKDIPGGGRILLGVLIQNSTFCVKLYVLNSDNRLQVFQECSFLMTHTHSYSFSYDWMVHSIYDSLVRNDETSDDILPIHHCVTCVVKRYEISPEPPHTRCWIKELTGIGVPCTLRTCDVPARKLFEHMVLNKDSLGLFTVEGAKGSKLMVLIIQNRINNYKFALVISDVNQKERFKDYYISCYLILAKHLNSPPLSSLSKESLYVRSRNESMTTISTASTSPGSIRTDDGEVHLVRPRMNSEIYRNEAESKRELYAKARLVAEEELRSLFEASQRSYRRSDLVQCLVRCQPRSSIALELSANFSKTEQFSSAQLAELEMNLSVRQGLVQQGSSIHWLFQKWETGRYKKLLDFLKEKSRVEAMSIVMDPDKSEVAVLTNTQRIPGRVEKVAIVVLRHQGQKLNVSAIMKSELESEDNFYVSFWERVLSLICVYVWERLLAGGS
eukprot:sb/3461002/